MAGSEEGSPRPQQGQAGLRKPVFRAWARAQVPAKSAGTAIMRTGHVKALRFIEAPKFGIHAFEACADRIGHLGA